MDISDRIKEIIKCLIGEHRGAIAEFSHRCGFRTGHVNAWLQNRAKPGVLNRNKICATFNVSPEWLNEGRGEMLVESTPVKIGSHSDLDVGMMMGELKALKEQVVRYETRLNKYDSEILSALNACRENRKKN